VKPNLYLIPGLGVDERIFRKLYLPEYNLIYLKWITPHKHETLASYAIRLAKQIDTATPFYLLGVSFGGMLATEIAKRLQPLKTIIVSSVATSNKIPLHLRIAASLHLDSIAPASLLKSANPFSYWLFGTGTPEEKALLKNILEDIDPIFMKWALRAIADWLNTTVPKNLIHIHGTADKVLPISSTVPSIRIAGGGHLMVFSKADHISKLLIDQLSK
jgi:pimeloyl-ACP methyl ester carboxylesterase